MKYWLITTRDDILGYYVFAATQEGAVKAAEALCGPLNPVGRVIKQLPVCPEGYRLSDGMGDQILEAYDEET